MIYTKDWILAKARTGLSVHKYSYSQEKLRKKTKRMCKDGVLIMVEQDKEKFYYKLAD
ncbi:hypothetical protein [Pseudomonas phage vB_PsaM_M1]|nr:hypothetical protein [Pseudomonas phage vB_PsaM_M1]